MGNKKCIFFIASLSCIALGSTNTNDQKSLVIITASYNNEQWIEQYFNSIVQQYYENWTLVYIDDNSTDNTLSAFKTLVHQYGIEDRVTLIRNDTRMGHLYNQYHAIHACRKNDIIIIIDGDDWLAHEHVFERIMQAYENENVWLTYGQFWYLKKNKKGFCKPIPADIIAQNAIRDISWRTSHPRTFYAGLFQLIRLEDLLYHGTFFPKCADVVTMLPMIEMAGNHITCIDEVLYIYNDDNPLSYHHDPTHQRTLEAYIKAMPRYQPLKEKPW